MWRKRSIFFVVLFIISWNLRDASAKNTSVRVEKSPTGWQLWVNQQPYLVRGVCYWPIRIGESPNEGTLEDWMIQDTNQNGRIDGPYESWVDRNKNNIQDRDEPTVGDFKLLQQLGANTIRIYHHPSNQADIQALHNSPTSQRLYNHAPNKALLRDLYQTYGIRVAMGDLLGAYAVGSGASWEQGTDYRDPQQRQRMLRSVENMILEFKDEPFILLWVLGNENRNGSSTHTNAAEYPTDYAKFVNQVAQRIHLLDPDHPVAVCDLNIPGFSAYTRHMPDVDIYGVNSYRSPGFGGLWKDIADVYDKPVLITEYGVSVPKFSAGRVDETYHAMVYQKAWEDIAAHALTGTKEPRNSIGGFAFEWLDNWWQDGDPWNQNRSSGWNHEVCGLASQGNGQQSPFLRQLRKSYYALKTLWTQ